MLIIQKAQNFRKKTLGMEEFKQNIKLILSTLGYTFHENAAAKDKAYKKYYIKAKGLKAKGIYTSEGIVVLEGSQVARKEVPSIHDYLKNLRKEKQNDGSMVDKNGYYEVVQRITFSSLSTATGFVLGRSANGCTEWKNSNGKTIDEIERKSLEKKK